MPSFLARRIVEVPPSGIRQFFDIAATMKEVISLGIGEPDFVTPTPVLQAGIDSLQQGQTHYTSNSGLLELREALSLHLHNLYGVRYQPEDEILMTVGVSEALYLALTAVLNPGDEVIVPQPCFVAYVPEVIFAGGVPLTVPTRVEEGFQVTAEAIERQLTPRTKVVLMGYPNNPTGAVMDQEKLEQIAQLAEQHNLLVVSDEIYDRLVYGQKHLCFASFGGMRERTITLGGFSKDYAMTGWRIGYAAAPAELLTAMRKIHQYTIMSAPTPAQHAAWAALRSGESFVHEMLSEYDRRRRMIVAGLNQLGLDCFEPKGAFYTFPSIRRSGMDDEEFARRLLEEEHVAVVPGRAFGKSGEGFVRCSYATAYEKIEEALHRMGRFLSRHG
ncbi:MAG: aminotransferase class I/II-fold pyridoxal phosphate-dependent enzyme [Anaerolineales bacterium]|jgi:aminotransferase